jgi:transposase
MEPLVHFAQPSRRLAKDFENLSRNALAFLRLASIRLMLKKLCNQ